MSLCYTNFHMKLGNICWFPSKAKVPFLPRSVWDLRQVIKAVWLKLPSLRSWGKSLGDCRLWPINIWKGVSICVLSIWEALYEATSLTQVQGHGMGLLSGVFPPGTALPLFPTAMQSHGIAPALKHVWPADKKADWPACCIWLQVTDLKRGHSVVLQICEKLGRFSAKGWGAWVLTLDLAGLAASLYDYGCHCVSA